RPFGAFIDWALLPDRSVYRTLGMGVAGGEDLEIDILHPESEVELDSAESALLFGCHLQVREARLLDDGEIFYVPRTCASVRAARARRRGPGTSTSSRGLRRSRSPERRDRGSASFGADRAQACHSSAPRSSRAPMTESETRSRAAGRPARPPLRRP